MILSFTKLRSHLGINAAQLQSLVKKGLPWEGKSRKKRFNLEAVNTWLVEHGYAEQIGTTPTGFVCRTYAELARALGMRGKDPVRIIQRWATEPGWPGRPASPGKQDGFLPVSEIQAWLATRQPATGGIEGDDEIRELKREIARLDLEAKKQEALVVAGKMADVDEVARICLQHIAAAKAILEPLPERVVQLLPVSMSADARRQVYNEVQTLLDSAYEEIADTIEEDEEGNGDED